MAAIFIGDGNRRPNSISNCMLIYMYNTERRNCVVTILPSELNDNLYLSFQNQIAVDQDNDKNVLLYVRGDIKDRLKNTPWTIMLLKYYCYTRVNDRS